MADTESTGSWRVRWRWGVKLHMKTAHPGAAQWSVTDSLSLQVRHQQQEARVWLSTALRQSEGGGWHPRVSYHHPQPGLETGAHCNASGGSSAEMSSPWAAVLKANPKEK